MTPSAWTPRGGNPASCSLLFCRTFRSREERERAIRRLGLQSHPVPADRAPDKSCAPWDGKRHSSTTRRSCSRNLIRKDGDHPQPRAACQELLRLCPAACARLHGAESRDSLRDESCHGFPGRTQEKRLRCRNQNGCGGTKCDWPVRTAQLSA